MLDFLQPTKKQFDIWSKFSNQNMGHIAIERQGNFTVAVTRMGAVMFTGVAKMNPEADEDIPERGEAIAIAQAARSANGGERNG